MSKHQWVSCIGTILAFWKNTRLFRRDSNEWRPPGSSPQSMSSGSLAPLSRGGLLASTRSCQPLWRLACKSLLLIELLTFATSSQVNADDSEDLSPQLTSDVIRIASFNASLNRSRQGELIEDLEAGDEQAKTIAAIIQHVRPAILLVNEFDYDPRGEAAKLFREHFLAVPQSDELAGIEYAYFYAGPVNTGIPSGLNLDHDDQGRTDSANDAFGYGAFPGQYGMVVYSQFPIDEAATRTFQNFLWKDMPRASLPDDPTTTAQNDWYSPTELAVMRLSSKSHWDLPIAVGSRTLHLLAAHPTPPVFDGEEDRNGRRNHDEIKFWADYIGSASQADYIYDDEGDAVVSAPTVGL